jgi:carbonic anhydrase
MEDQIKLFLSNRAWAAEKLSEDASYFENLAKDQRPEYLWIGCSDSRVPANEIIGAEPGELFVHRNVANMVVHTDLNLLSVLQYAVEFLEVKHIIVCGHTGCGGVKASLTNKDYGLLNKWLRNLKDVYRLHKDEVEAETNIDDKVNKLVEINLIEQVGNVVKTSIVQKAWKQHKRPHVHGWVYEMETGLLRTVIDVEPGASIDPMYEFREE